MRMLDISPYYLGEMVLTLGATLNNKLLKAAQHYKDTVNVNKH